MDVYSCGGNRFSTKKGVFPLFSAQNSTKTQQIDTGWKTIERPLIDSSFSYIKFLCVFNEILWGNTSKSLPYYDAWISLYLHQKKHN